MPGGPVQLCHEPICVDLVGDAKTCSVTITNGGTLRFHCSTDDLEFVVTRNRGLQMSAKDKYVNFSREGKSVRVEFCVEKNCTFARVPIERFNEAVARLRQKEPPQP